MEIKERSSKNTLTVINKDGEYPKEIEYKNHRWVFGTSTAPPESYQKCAIYFREDWLYS